MGWLSSGPGLAIATVLLTFAVVGGLYVAFTPSRRVPRARRRPVAEHAPSLISRAAEAATTGAGRLLAGREGQLERSLELAGVKARPQDFVVLTASGAVALFASGLLIWGPLAGLLLLLVSPLLAWAFLNVRTSRRRAAFAKQLDETLQILAGSLRAGYSLPQAASTVASEAEAPTSEEFARIINETRVGRPMIDALEESAQRVQSDDFYWVAQAIAINREVGGNLADVLDGVGHTIRERAQLRRQVDSLSAEGRLSAIVLGGLPFAMLLVLSVGNPDYVATFGESALGIFMLVVAAIMLTVGLLWLRAAIRIKY